MSVDSKFKENLMHILKNVELSRSQRYYGLIDEASLIKYFKKNYNIDLHKNDSKIVNLKETIINSIPENLNILEKARYIYNKLGELLEYSDIYQSLDEDSRKQFYNQTTDINNTDLSNIICKNWAELYYQLLVDAGIDPKNITISGSSEVLKHRWINIKIAPNISVVADAVNPSGSYTYDLNKIKNHLKTDGFVIYYGQDAKIVWEEFQFPNNNNNNIKKLSKVSKISDVILRHIDKKIGYIDDKYQDEKLKDITDNFNTYKLEQEILKNDTTDTIDIYRIKDMVKPGYNLLTVYGYLKILLANTYNKNSDYSSKLNFEDNKKGAMNIYNNDSNLANGLLTLKITRESDNKSVLYIYTSHNGLVEITEDGLQDIMKRIKINNMNH